MTPTVKPTLAPGTEVFRIVETVARHYRIEISVLLSRAHTEPHRTARMLAMCLTNILCGLRTTDVGHLFGRSPNNVNHARRRIAELWCGSRQDRRQMEPILAELGVPHEVLHLLRMDAARGQQVRVYLANLDNAEAAMVRELVAVLSDDTRREQRHEMLAGRIALRCAGQAAAWQPVS